MKAQMSERQEQGPSSSNYVTDTEEFQYMTRKI